MPDWLMIIVFTIFLGVLFIPASVAVPLLLTRHVLSFLEGFSGTLDKRLKDRVEEFVVVIGAAVGGFFICWIVRG